MELKIVGKIKLINDLQTFDSGFIKREFVITTDEQYPQDVKFEIVKEKAENFTNFNKVGDDVIVSFNVRGNEFKEKYYVNLQAWHVLKTGDGVNPDKSNPTKAAELIDEGADDLPF